MFKDKNTLFGAFLIGLLTALFFYYLSQKPKMLAQAKTETSKDSLHTAPKTAAAVEVSSPTAVKIQDTATPLGEWATYQNGQEKLYFVENDLMKIFFSNKGGRISKVVLKKYKNHKGGPVELMNQQFSQFGYELDKINTKNLFFEVQGSSTTIKNKENTTISFFIASNGKRFKQNYHISGDSYLIDYSLEQIGMAAASDIKLVWNEELQLMEGEASRERMYSSVYYLDPNEKDIQHLDLAKNEEKVVPNMYRWISHKQQFFNATLISKTGFKGGRFASAHMNDDTGYVKRFKTTVNMPAADKIEMQWYIGPNSYNLLKSLDFGGEKLVQLSPDFVLLKWTKIFNEYFIIPLFNFLSKFFSSYGIIILIMTLIVKMLLLPLSYKTFKLGVATKVLKPELDEIRKKYGDDQQRFAQEQMKVMSQAGVSQLSGCLPALLQIPLLIAMVNFFPASIELRQEPFLWAHDLSTYDNVLDLPFSFFNHLSLFTLLMSITQIAMTWYMQRNQPSNPMNEQMKYMTYLMPVMLFFMFNGWPAAMTYYYLLQNVISIAQQWAVTKFFISEESIRAEIEAYRKAPKKKGMFQQKMDEMMAQAEEMKKQQQKQKK